VVVVCHETICGGLNLTMKMTVMRLKKCLISKIKVQDEVENKERWILCILFDKRWLETPRWVARKFNRKKRRGRVWFCKVEEIKGDERVLRANRFRKERKKLRVFFFFWVFVYECWWKWYEYDEEEWGRRWRNGEIIRCCWFTEDKIHLHNPMVILSKKIKQFKLK